MPIQVRLDPAANPPVTVHPNPFAVNRGNHVVEWVPAAQQQFTFVSLTGLPSSAFSPPSVSGTQITVTDNNANAGDYGYTIVVSANGQQYSTAQSVAKAGALQASAGVTAAAKPLIAGPIIQNK